MYNSWGVGGLCRQWEWVEKEEEESWFIIKIFIIYYWFGKVDIVDSLVGFNIPALAGLG